MKWAIAGLVALGIVAALSASLLVGALRTSKTISQATQPSDPEVTIYTASRAFQAMTIIDEGALVETKLKKSEAPEGAIFVKAQLIGKILSSPVVSGQPLTKSCFPADGTGTNLAAKLPPGMRAVTVSITDYGALSGLLYPGCIVDVLVSSKSGDSSSDQDSRRGAAANTLLESVQVLAIESQTILNQGEKLTGAEDRRPGSTVRVTLRVDPRQARSLQLAMQEGTLSLSLRNPTDDSKTEPEQKASIIAPIGPASTNFDVTVIRGGKVETNSIQNPPLPDKKPEPVPGKRTGID